MTSATVPWRWGIRIGQALVVVLACLGPSGFEPLMRAHADIPMAEDIAACNRNAKDSVQQGGAWAGVPNTGDHRRATEARRPEARPDNAGEVTYSPDAQLDGMDAEGAKDPVYQAAFRTCMRRSGF